MTDHEIEYDPTDDEIVACASASTPDEWDLIVDAECEAVHADLAAAGVL
jgi:hypothetical protein